MLYDYRRVGGEAAVDLSLSFPLLASLTVADLDIKAEAQVSKFSLKNALGELDLKAMDQDWNTPRKAVPRIT